MPGALLEKGARSHGRFMISNRGSSAVDKVGTTGRTHGPWRAQQTERVSCAAARLSCDTLPHPTAPPPPEKTWCSSRLIGTALLRVARAAIPTGLLQALEPRVPTCGHATAETAGNLMHESKRWKANCNVKAAYLSLDVQKICRADSCPQLWAGSHSWCSFPFILTTIINTTYFI